MAYNLKNKWFMKPFFSQLQVSHGNNHIQDKLCDIQQMTRN